MFRQGSGTSSSGGESSCDESRIRKPRLRTAEPRLRTTALNEKLREDCPIDEPGSSDYNSSTGEESCDTVIYVGPDGVISDRELTDNEGPPIRLPIKNSNVSSSTRSLVRKLESIENEDTEDNEGSGAFKREVEGREDRENLVEEDAQEEVLEREQGEGSECYTEESCYETEIEFSPENRAGSRKRVHEKKNSSWSSLESAQEEPKRTKTYQSDCENSNEKELHQPTENNTLILPSSLGPNLDVDESMNSRNSTIVIPVQSFPGEEAKLRARVMSPETSSESSDAESIVMAKAPSFSFLTCEAVNEFPTDSISMESLNMEQDLHEYELSRHGGNAAYYRSGNATDSLNSLNSECDECDFEVSRHYDNRESHVKAETTAELIKNCLPSPSPTSDTNELCYVVEETRETSSEELSYDDTEIVWGKEHADNAIIAEAFCDEEQDMEGNDDTKRNFTGNETDILFPELEQRLQDVSACVSVDPTVQKTINLTPSNRQNSDDSATDSDTDVTRSFSFETPLKTFYRLVPSPQSSSTEDELEDIQVSKSFHGSKLLSPIPEFPSVESNLNQADSRNGTKNRVSCSYSIVSVEIDDGNTTVLVEGDKENIPVANMPESSDKGDLRSLLQKFVAEQLRECEGEKFSSRYVRPAARHPENRRPRPRPNRRIVPLASCDTSNNDILLPPLVPQKRTYTETAKLISSPKLRYRGERDYDSDTAPFTCRTAEGDESSDSSMTAKTEPWCTPSRGVAKPIFESARRLSSLSVGNVKTSVTFLGSEDENNNFHRASDVERTCIIDDELNNEGPRERLNPENSESRTHYIRAESPTKRRDRTSVSSVSSFVKLTYCGSELSDTEFAEKPDKQSKEDKPCTNDLSTISSRALSVSVERPIIECIPLMPETPYAPQEEFIARFHDRCTPPRIVYRLSGEFVATIPSDSPTSSQETEDVVATKRSSNRQYRLSGEFVATFTTAADTQNASTLALMSSNTEVGSAKTESTEVVWVQHEPVVSAEDVTADELSGPSTPVPTRSGKFGKFKFFG